jgi:hypothetical protein
MQVHFKDTIGLRWSNAGVWALTNVVLESFAATCTRILHIGAFIACVCN